jgi:ubiquitin-like 1-activating enzyme E1 B
VAKQLSMDKYKGAKFTPQPVALATVDAAVGSSFPAGVADAVGLPPPPSVAGGRGWDRNVWSPTDCLAELCSCVAELWGDAAKSGAVGTYAFDKDDKTAMRFVAAAANLRGAVFSIESLNFHDVKGVAGNIVPAIATTNAIVAGQQVTELFKVLAAGPQPNLREVCKYTYWRRFPTRQGHLLQPTTLDSPNPHCYVCAKAVANVYLDTAAWTFEGFLAKVVKGRLGFNEPTVSYGSGSVWEEGDDADTAAFAPNLPKTLAELPAGGVVDGVMVCVDDYSQDVELQLRVHHLSWSDVDGEQHPEGFHVGDEPPKPAEAAEEAPADAAGEKGAGGDDAGLAAGESASESRKRTAAEVDASHDVKKARS